MKERNLWFVKYIVGVLVCGGVAAVVLLNRDMDGLTEKKDVYKALCDAFCVPGVLFLLFSALLAVAREGAFDGVSYVFRRAFFALIPGGRNKVEKYADYKEQKEAKREKKVSFRFMLIVGGAFLAVSLVFLALYYSV